MFNLVKEIEKLPLSEQELLALADKKANLVLYPDISKYKTIDQLLGRHGACIILYITNMDDDSIFGHWTCIFKVDDKTLEWFDPYAYIFDTQMDFSNYKYPPYLTNLLDKSNYNIVYNKHILQDRNNTNISTCGRHVGMRLICRTLPIGQYAAMLNSMPPLTPDNLVTLMTAFIKS